MPERSAWNDSTPSQEVPLFDSFEKIVVFEVVPDAWMTKVMECAM